METFTKVLFATAYLSSYSSCVIYMAYMTYTSNSPTWIIHIFRPAWDSLPYHVEHTILFGHIWQKNVMVLFLKLKNEWSKNVSLTPDFHRKWIGIEEIYFIILSEKNDQNYFLITIKHVIWIIMDKIWTKYYALCNQDVLHWFC